MRAQKRQMVQKAKRIAAKKKQRKEEQRICFASGKRAKAMVFSGRSVSAKSSLMKDDLVKNRAGKVVSKARSLAGKKAYANIAVWAMCVEEARMVLGITGWHKLKKGDQVYELAMKNYSPLRFRKVPTTETQI